MRAIAKVNGPVVLIANLLTEGRQTDYSRPVCRAACVGDDGRKVDAWSTVGGPPCGAGTMPGRAQGDAAHRRRAEGCEIIEAGFGCARSRGTIAGAWRTPWIWRGSCCSDLGLWVFGPEAARTILRRPRLLVPASGAFLFSCYRHRPLHHLQHVSLPPWPCGCCRNPATLLGDVGVAAALCSAGRRSRCRWGHHCRCLIISQLRPSPPFVRISESHERYSRRGAAA
jgi:hypothetical protein